MNPFSPQEIQELRSLFPVTENFIYLNHAAVGPFSRPVAEAIREFTDQALHLGFTAGPLWQEKVAAVRKDSARLIGASPEEIAFVKNTSHGISLIARGLNLRPRDEVIISDVEFPSNVYPWMALEPHGVFIKKVPCENGELKFDRLKSLITSRTRVISLSSAQYGNGFRLLLPQIGKYCRERGIYFLVDAIQSLGAFPIDVIDDSIDFLSADAHKWMLGPEGIGIFYIRRELLEKIEPMILGWNSVAEAHDFDQIRFTLRPSAERFEEGSLNTLSLYGLGAAVDLLLQIGVDRIAQRILYLTDLLIDGLQRMNLMVTSSLKPEHRSGIVSFQIREDPKGRKLAPLERQLFSQKIFASVRRGSFRLSPHFYNSEEEIEIVLRETSHFLRNLLRPPPVFSND